VNRSAANAGVIEAARSSDYRLTVEGRGVRTRTFDLAAVEALPVSRAHLPIACVEGWSYSARWSGVRLRDLLDLVGAPRPAAVRVESLEAGGPYRTAFVDHFQAADPSTLLATHLAGARLSLDHGYPLRLIAPDRAGVLQTKWVTKVVVL
jgi:DMSO/TMAO reductase YedYZ molybdopterin-dependent catalytic subunit